ncbi:hypothetical protein S40285_06935 [Stachybotrys chlorohalonatus IBT 40285]|uniref:Ring-like domain-containing protein n=1 Tax=Stachybotrys chlorohalonatus (strain IBT 40285) TaxID=1283841 RepID=A0A084QBB0_STAC4|nr:hypothetical protein S40285_06935 [Stachybotrys chlorohalonata IBT 40285]
MLEYFAVKKYRKNKAEKEAADEAAQERPSQPQTPTETHAASSSSSRRGDDESRKPPLTKQDTAHSYRDGRPVLDAADEQFLESIIAAEDDGPAPPLPPRVYDWQYEDGGSSSSSVRKGKEIDGAQGVKVAEKEVEKPAKKPNRLSSLFNRKKKEEGLHPQADVPPAEGDRETKDLGLILDRLNLSAKNNKVISASTETSEALQKFTLIFKDLVNGVPTAYDDLVGLIKDRDGAMAKGFDKLPSSLQKLVMQLPEKVTSSLGPEILGAAAKSQGLEANTEGGMKNAIEKMILPQNIIELVTKPGALVGMLRAIVTTLKTRWPAFIGMNVIWSVSLFLLMLMLWYCYKRGREERLERERSGDAIDGSDRIEELPDDPVLPPPRSNTTHLGDSQERPASVSRTATGSSLGGSRGPRDNGRY